MKQKVMLPAIFSHRDEFLTPFDKLFDDMVHQAIPDFSKNFGIEDVFQKSAYPKCDIIDLLDKIQVEMEIPGVDKSDISIEVKSSGNNKELVISGKKSLEVQDERKNYIKKELKRSAFQRSFTLYDELNSEDINAEFKNGILKIDIPKKEPSKLSNVSTKVEIK